MAWTLSGVALLWLGFAQAWYALLWWSFSTPVRNWNGHIHRIEPPSAPLSWAACVALGALTALWFVYKVKGARLPVLGLGLALVLGVALTPTWIRCRCHGPDAACKNNLRLLAVSLEMYATDYGGHFPGSADMLTPGYVKTIPSCPWGLPYSISLAPDAYTAVCRDVDHYHRRGYPQYTSSDGLAVP